MDNSVIIKGNNHGITVVLAADEEYEKLKATVGEKFKESSKFLGNASVVLGFEGKKLTSEQERELLDIISENCELQVVCLVDNNAEREELYERILAEKNPDTPPVDLSKMDGEFYKGTLRSGQTLDFAKSVIVLGDINPGATVFAGDNILILGSLKGQAIAGMNGNENAFVFAIEMDPTNIKIGEHWARSADDKPVLKRTGEMQIAFLEDGQICLEPISKKIWNDIRL